MLKEQKLIAKCKDGDLAAFEAVFDSYGRKLFGLCLRMSGSHEDAEDLMQEIFMVLLTKIKGFRGESKFSTWLYRIAVNTCLNHIRKQKGIMVSLNPEEERPEWGSSADSPSLQRTALKRAISSLPPGYRAAVILHDIQGFNHKEIAGILGISEGASKSQLFKARRKLRDYMKVSYARGPATSGNPGQVGK